MIFALLLGCIITLGAVTVWFYEATMPRTFFGNRTIVGSVRSVDRRLDKTVLIVRDTISNESVQATLHDTIEALPGDTVQMAGIIEQPQDFMTATGRIFPYEQYLQSKNIAGIMNDPIVTITAIGNTSLLRIATTARFAIANVFTRYILFPVDGLVAGMLVGYQGGIPQPIQDLFRTTGVLHILVLSGENITLLAVFLSIVLRTLPFKIRTMLTAIAMLFIVLISGAGVAAVRAGIMGGMALLAGLVRRSYMPLRALTISVLFLFFTSPETIFSDPGFHLSVLATVFMILVFPKIEKIADFLPKKFTIRELTILAVCVPLFMLPYTMYFSGLVPLASPFANIIMAVLVPLFMLGGAIITALAWYGPFAQLLGTIISFVGSNTLKVLEVLNTLPQLNTPPLAWWGVLGAYALFFIMLFRYELKQFIFDQQNMLRKTSQLRTSSSEIRNQ